MKRKTFWLRKWAGWSLALACSFSNLPVLHGQSGQPKLPRSAGHPKGGDPVFGQHTVSELPVEKMQEDRLLLAWLNDPATFKLNLKVQSADGGIRITGCVPNDSVRKRVIEIASKTTGGFVQDGLKTVPGMLPGFSETLSPQQLHDKVQATILARVPGCASRIHIQTDSLGRVTLTGQVNTLKEVLEVCRCLRQVHQCHSVVNRLSLGGFSQPQNNLAANTGTPSVLPKNFPTIPQSKPSSNYPVPAPGVPVTQLSQPKVPQLPNSVVNNSGNSAPNTGAVKTSWSPVPSATSPTTQIPSSMAKLPAPGKSAGSNKVIQFDLGPPYEAIALVSLVKEDSPKTVQSETPVVKMKNWNDFPPLNPKKENPAPEPKIQPVKFEKESPAPLPKTNPVPPITTKTATAPKIEEVPPLLTKNAAAPKIHPVPPLPTNQVENIPPVPTQPVVKEPVLPKQTDNPPSVPPVPKNSPSPKQGKIQNLPSPDQVKIQNLPSPDQVKWLVEKHCGNMARNIVVRYLENGKMEIRLQVQQEAHATAVFEQIVRINELSPYQIKLKVEVVH